MIERGVTAKARRSSTEALTTRSRKPPQNDGFAYHGRPSSACRLKSSSPHADESVASIIDAMPISQSGRSSTSSRTKYDGRSSAGGARDSSSTAVAFACDSSSAGGACDSSSAISAAARVVAFACQGSNVTFASKGSRSDVTFASKGSRASESLGRIVREPR